MIAQQANIAKYIQDAKANTELINANKNFKKQEVFWTYEERKTKGGKNVTQCRNCPGH